MQSWVACDIKTEFQTRFEKKYVCSKGLYWPSHNVWCFPYNKIDRQIDVTVILFLLVQNRQQIHDWLDPGANGLGIQEWKVNQLNLKDLNQAKDRDYLLEQNQKKVRGFKKKIRRFSKFFENRICWRQFFEMSVIHKPSFRSCEAQHKICAQSV